MEILAYLDQVDLMEKMELLDLLDHQVLFKFT